ncbi:HAD family phosphatase [Shimia sp. CNT1-13L.2]|uniref:HAD family hydrolase n=1 Tax=Shimia sp. CNT1-13L.2 TaxID=2959663 RepID=UPI0020CEE7EF|nr:HAD family phosphatase [Shimia sp. CNT1-13L.2]MCP9480695.1 HAD family phosphatase [Shimia sp. CNT1-13L.2]
MRPDLVIFDCDGVLVDSEPVTNRAISENLAGYGLHLTVEECMAQFVGGTLSGVRDKARRMGADLPEDWVAEIHEATYAALRRGVSLIAGVRDLIDALEAAGVAYCVASNGSREKMRITLGQTGLWDRFEAAMFSARELGVAKPEPGLFLAAAKVHGVDPAACVVIEDSASGAKAAARAGMRCIGYVPEGAGVALRGQGAEVVTRMQEVAALLGVDG